MKVFLDDERDHKKFQERLITLGFVEDTRDWVWCLWPEEIIELLKSGQVTHLGLDHDLGDSAYRFQNRPEKTGMTVINWLEDQVFNHGFKPPEVIYCHSMNPERRREMRFVAGRIHKKWKELNE